MPLPQVVTAIGFDGDPETETQDASAHNWRHRCTIRTIGGPPVGLEHHHDSARGRPALPDVVGDPGVPSGIEDEIAQSSKQKVVIARIIDLDGNRPRIGYSKERGLIRIPQLDEK